MTHHIGRSFQGHKWAVTKTPADSPDGWWIHWGEVTQETPGAFPVTMVAR